MATSTISLTADKIEPCVLCVIKYDRARPSFCECKHCSILLCLDCTKEHHDEVLQDIAQISHQYNELQETLQIKQKLVGKEINKSIEDVNQYFETYIDELLQTQQKITADIQNAKQNAQNYLSKIGSDLRAVGTVIRDISKDNVAQPIKHKNLSLELKNIEQRIERFHIEKSENLTETVLTTTAHPIKLKNCIQFADIPIHESLMHTNRRQEYNEESQIVKTNHHDRRKTYVSTKFTVNLMASDGQNILYTSYDDQQWDVIAYCFIHKDRNREDFHQSWKQWRIIDMIWWKRLDRFVCATGNAIYTVHYGNKSFQIVSVLQGNWSHIRIAANANYIFVYSVDVVDDINEIRVFTSNFELIKRFNAEFCRYLSASSSFCVTNTILASINICSQHRRQVFQVNFFDLHMQKLNWFPLGTCNDSIQIRSDGNERFFITTGKRKLYIILSNGLMNTIDLEHSGSCISVLDNQRIGISNERSDIELINY